MAKDTDVRPVVRDRCRKGSGSGEEDLRLRGSNSGARSLILGEPRQDESLSTKSAHLKIYVFLCSQ